MWLRFWSPARGGRDADTGGQGAVCTPEIGLLLLYQDDGPALLLRACTLGLVLKAQVKAEVMGKAVLKLAAPMARCRHRSLRADPMG